MNIYVGNLNYKVNEEQLRELFSAHGNVSSVKLITNKHTGQSKGYAFITFEDQASGDNAIEKCNEMEFEGRRLKVSRAHKADE